MNAATRDIIKQARVICQANLAQYHYHIALPPLVFNISRSVETYPTEKEAKQAIGRTATKYKRIGYPVERRGSTVHIAGHELFTAACKEQHV